MSLNSRNQMRRFISLIDTLYDQKARLVVTAAAPIDRLFDFSDNNFAGSSTDNLLMDDLKIKKGDVSQRS